MVEVFQAFSIQGRFNSNVKTREDYEYLYEASHYNVLY
jgi:hypothetical protein